MPFIHHHQSRVGATGCQTVPVCALEATVMWYEELIDHGLCEDGFEDFAGLLEYQFDDH